MVINTYTFAWIPGCPVSDGTGASTALAYRLKASLGGGLRAIRPVCRERFDAAVVMTPAHVQTADIPFVPSVLPRERRT